MIWDVVKASVHQSKERICREMFPSFGGNVRHGEPCYVNGQSFMCMGYFRTHSYAKATGMSRWVLDFMARRELLAYIAYNRRSVPSMSSGCASLIVRFKLVA